MVLEGTVKVLAQQVLGGAYRIHLEANGTTRLEETFKQLNGVVRVRHPAVDCYELETKNDLRAEAARAVIEAGGELLALNVEAPSLDEIYTRYFQKQEVDHAIAA
jgi:ABC-2 type transport system ATP-binding protein